MDVVAERPAARAEMENDAARKAVADFVAKPAEMSVKILSMKLGELPVRSAIDNGHISTKTTRPARDSDRVGMVRNPLEPERMKRSGLITGEARDQRRPGLDEREPLRDHVIKHRILDDEDHFDVRVVIGLARRQETRASDSDDAVVLGDFGECLVE